MNNSHEFDIEVYNSNGESQPVMYSGNTPDISELPSGMYTIRFLQGDDSYIDRIVKE